MVSVDANRPRAPSWSGPAPRHSLTVSVLAAAAEHTDCTFSKLALAGRVNLEKLFGGTRYEPGTGADPLAIKRGRLFEEILKKDDYAELLNLLYEQDAALGATGTIGAFGADARIARLRDLPAPAGRSGLEVRAEATRGELAKIARRDWDAPTLIDGAVIRARIGGEIAYFEADGLAAASNGALHVVEAKSFPLIDGRCDPVKLGAACAQAGLYAALVRAQLLEDHLPASTVSDTGFIVLPKNTRLGRAVLLRQNLSFHIRRAERLLSLAHLDAAAVKRIEGRSFPAEGTGAAERVEGLSHLMDQAGTHYRPECLEHCAAAKLCRERAYQAGRLAILGDQASREMSGVESLERVLKLAAGADPLDHERESARELVRARKLYRRVLREAKS